jgi:hypothetical protein
MFLGALVVLPNISSLLARKQQTWSLELIANVAGTIAGLSMFIIGTAILLEVGEFRFE